MSFRSDFTAALLSDVETQLSLNAGDAYAGHVDRKEARYGSPEARVEYLGHLDGRRASKVHRFAVHLTLRDQPTNRRTYASMLTELEGHAETLVDAYNGEAPFVSTVTTVLTAKASVDEPEIPEDDDQPLRLPVLLEVHES